MTALEKEPIAAIPTPLLPVDQYTEIGKQAESMYDYPDLGRVVMRVGPEDSRIDVARELEVQNMAELGDRPEEVWAEFEPFQSDSVFLLAFARDKEPVEKNILGMMRIIPATGPGRIKTLNDLAEIANRKGDTVAVADLEAKFMKESGCADLMKVAEIATLATADKPGNMGSMRQKLTALREWHKTPDSLSRAVIQYMIDAYHAGDLTHIVSFNDVNAHKYFTTRLGYPLQPMFGLGPMMYSTFSDTGMIAQPAWGRIEDALEAVRSRRTKHLQAFATKTRVLVGEQ